MNDLKKGWDKLKKEFSENPLQVIAIAALSVTATAKLIDVIASSRSKSAYAKIMRESARRNRRY